MDVRHSEDRNEVESVNFYEELQADHQYDSSYHETITGFSSYSETGLREDDVHKLTDDILNPLPPVDPN